MLTAKNWSRRVNVEKRPWLILGKGPTFRKFRPQHAQTYGILALNHVAREVKSDAALMMDLDVFQTCADRIMANADFILMPWRPHIDFRPTEKTLLDLLEEEPLLRSLDEQNRLVVFNAQTASDFEQFPGEPVTPIKFFSAEAALNLLVSKGASNIRTLGVDGGAAYSPSFSDLEDTTLLANGRANFDQQFRMFAEVLKRTPDLIFGPLNIQVPVRVFIGADETQVLGARVLEFSIKRHASVSVKCEIINNDGLPVPADPLRRARTGFSFSRFKIPQLCSFRGRGIYVDADMQVFADIKDLWTRDFGDAWLLYSELSQSAGQRIPQYSVMLLDCEKLNWDAEQLVSELDTGKYDYAQLMASFAMMPSDRKQARLEFEWNSLEHYEEGKTRLIHYTDMPTQPWVSDKNKHGEIWYAELRRAVADGFITMAEIYSDIEKGFVSPLLPQWAKLQPYPKADKLLATWTPPYKRFERPAGKVLGQQ
jgi:hypothetical protein